jgi:hypothetical protein
MRSAVVVVIAWALLPVPALANWCTNVTYDSHIARAPGSDCNYATQAACEQARGTAGSGVSTSPCYSNGAAGPAAGNGDANAGAAAAGAALGTAIHEWIANAPDRHRKAQQDEGVRLNDHALQVERQDNWDQAVSELRRALELYDHPAIRQNLAFAIFQQTAYKYAPVGTPEGDAALASYQEALRLSEPGSTVQQQVRGAIAEIERERVEKEQNAVAASVVRGNLRHELASQPAAVVGTGSGLAFSGASGNSGGLGMRATAPADVGSARSPATVAQPDSLTALKAASAGSSAASTAAAQTGDPILTPGGAPSGVESAASKAGCTFDNAGAHCAPSTAAVVPHVPVPVGTLVSRADVLAGELGPVAQKPDVKAALDMYRNFERVKTDQQAKVDQYADLVKQGGPDAQKYSAFLDDAKGKLAVAQQDQTQAKAQVSKALLNYSVALPDDAL